MITTKIIGLTGGIGSGKTTVANYFRALNIPVYIADDEAKKLYNIVHIKTAVATAFGNEIIENNVINKKKLAEIVFNNPDKLLILNKIIHPGWKSIKKIQLLLKKLQYYSNQEVITTVIL